MSEKNDSSITVHLKAIAGLMLVAFLSLGLTGCETDGPAEEAGEEIDQAVDNAGDAIEDAADEVEESVDENT